MLQPLFCAKIQVQGDPGGGGGVPLMRVQLTASVVFPPKFILAISMSLFYPYV